MKSDTLAGGGVYGYIKSDTLACCGAYGYVRAWAYAYVGTMLASGGAGGFAHAYATSARSFMS